MPKADFAAAPRRFVLDAGGSVEEAAAGMLALLASLRYRRKAGLTGHGFTRR